MNIPVHPATRIPEIAARLKAIREALKMNQRQFAIRAGIAANTYNQWEMAKGRPDLDQAIQLCETYSLTLDWIYRGIPSGLPLQVATLLAGGAMPDPFAPAMSSPSRTDRGVSSELPTVKVAGRKR